MDVFQIIGLCAACITIGATCMHAHNYAINRAVEYERQRQEKRAERLRSERDNYAQLLTAANNQIAKMQIEQANAAGYEDGYRACYKDYASEEYSATLSDAIYNGLQNGKGVRLSVINH